MKQLYGVLLVVVSAAAFGAMAVLAPVAYNAGTNPITLLFLRFTIAGLAMTMCMVVRKKEFPRGKLLLSLVLMGAVWYVAQSLAYFTALTMASAGLVVLLLYLYPALVALISAIVFRERMTGPKLASLGMALAGTALTIGPSGEGESLGILLALTAAVLYATYIVVGGELMEQVEALPATTVIMLAAGISYGGIVAVQGFQAPSETGGWMAIVATAGCSIVAIGTFFSGLEKVGAANAAVLSTVEPFVTVGLAALVLRERIEAIQLVGGFCILIAVAFLARGEFVEVDRGSAY
jgi:drug/metabolite transporter (DMT)-like permease